MSADLKPDNQRLTMLRNPLYEINPFAVAMCVLASFTVVVWRCPAVTSVGTDTGSGKTRANGFFRGSGPSIVLSVVRTQIVRHRNWLFPVLCILVCVATALTAMFEWYYRVAQCSTSIDYQNRLSDFTRSVIAILHSLDCEGAIIEADTGTSADRVSRAGRPGMPLFGVPPAAAASICDGARLIWWVDFASLLSIIRHARIRYDPDHDFSIIAPPKPYSHSTLRSSFQRFGIRSRYDEKRDLIQLYDASGRFHVDLWIWRDDTSPQPVTSGNESGGYEPIISSPETGTRYRHRKRSDLFPLQRTAWPALTGATAGDTPSDVSVWIPNRSAVVSQKEYGALFMTPEWSRADCFHNTFALRWL